MKKVLLKAGKITLENVPDTGLPGDHELSVDVYATTISAGTETASVVSSPTNWRKNLELAGKAFRFAKERGFSAFLAKVKERTAQGFAPGYSASGIVTQIGPNVSYLSPGDRVACAGGNFASHAEKNIASSMLTVKMPDNISFEEASTVSIGAIALQGVRRLKPQLGDNVAVIGLGLIGQLTAQMLTQSGTRTIGIEADASRLELARSNGWIEHGLVLDEPDFESRILHATNKFGVDGVIICAHSPGNPKPLELAAKIARPRGRVIIVGDVGINVAREIFYKKDLELKIATSYGPGRYDLEYETKGRDYPYSFVRWSASRNMSCYLDLIANKKITLAPLLNAAYKVDDAQQAYSAITDKNGPKPILTVLTYPKSGDREQETGDSQKKKETIKSFPTTLPLNIGIIGAGNFMTSVHLPILAKFTEKVNITAICNKHPEKASFIAKQYNAPIATSNYKDILDNPDINLVLIGTRHNLHAAIARDCINAGKNIFLEKPMALNMHEIEYLEQAIKQTSIFFHLGFNRRFSSLVHDLKTRLKSLPKPWFIDYRVATENLPADHWAIGEEGGGRVLGEACHMVDLLDFLASADAAKSITPAAIKAQMIDSKNCENFSAILRYPEGTSANLTYASCGSKEFSKERIEVMAGGYTMVLTDFKRLEIADQKGRKKVKNLSAPDKGFSRAWDACFRYLEGKTADAPLPFEEALKSTLATFSLEETLRGTENINSH
ncbi:bi-domain-containing oxidoreductase [Elusimicrobiota bacterium]